MEKTSVYYETYGEFQLLSREGSITIPKIGFNEPLKAQAQYFLQCIEKNQPPVLADAGKAAADVAPWRACENPLTVTASYNHSLFFTSKGEYLGTEGIKRG